MDSACAHGSHQPQAELTTIKELSSVSKPRPGTQSTPGPTTMKLVILTTTSHALVSESHLESMLAIVECSPSPKATKSTRSLTPTSTLVNSAHGLTSNFLPTTLETMLLSLCTPQREEELLLLLRLSLSPTCTGHTIKTLLSMSVHSSEFPNSWEDVCTI